MTRHPTAKSISAGLGVTALLLTIAWMIPTHEPVADGSATAPAEQLRRGSGRGAALVPFRSDILHAEISGAREASSPLLRVSIRGDDKPLGGVEVTVRTEDDVLFQETSTGGQASIRLRHPGHVSVHADAPGRTAASAETDVPDAGAEVALTLLSSSSLGGTVTGLTAQFPPLSVVAASVADPSKMHTASVSSTGGFRIDALPAGTYAVGVAPQAFLAHEVVVHVEPGEHGDVELALPEAGSLEVSAVLPDATGAPRQAFLRLVRLADRAEVTRPLSLTSRVAQRIDAVPVGVYAAELSVTDAAHLPEQAVEISAGGTSAVTFTLPASRIAGRVSTPDGPGAGAEVLAFKVVPGAGGREVRGNNPEITAHADDDGSYALPGLSPGRYVVAARHAAAFGVGTVDLGDGEDGTLDLELRGGNRTLETRVVYRGKPVQGAMVSATGEFAVDARSADTDADGVAQLAYLTGGTYLVRAVWLEDGEGPIREARAEIDLDGSMGSVLLQLN